jgi:hypothetical protein
MMLSRFASALVCSLCALPSCGPAHQQDTTTPPNPFSGPHKGTLVMHAPDAPADLRVRRLLPGLRADLAAVSSGQMYNVPPAIAAAFGPEQQMRVTDRGVTLGPISAAEVDALWLEGGGLSGPRIAHWKPADGELIRIANGEASASVLQVVPVNASTPTDVACPGQVPSPRFAWSDTIVIGDQLRVEQVSAQGGCSIVEVRKEKASATMELCPAAPSIAVGDMLRIDMRDLEQASVHQRSRILRIESSRETIWMIRGFSNELAAALAPFGVHALSWSVAPACGLTAPDGCGVGGLPAQVQVTFKPGDRSFALRASESVRGRFSGGADIELRVVRAAFRPFKTAECAHDTADFGMVLTQAGAPGAKATIAQ